MDDGHSLFHYRALFLPDFAVGASGLAECQWITVPEAPIQIPIGRDCTASSSGLEMRSTY